MDIWKDVIGFENYYQVSNLGHVYSLRTKKILKNGFSRGYPKVNLSIDSKKTMFEIHRLVAIAFIPNTENKRYVNHINGIKTDNRLENLEWVTASENNIHAYNTGLMISLKGADRVNSKLDNTSILVIREAREAGFMIKNIANYFKVTRGTISTILRGLAWSHVTSYPL